MISADAHLEHTITSMAGDGAVPRPDQRVAVRALVDDRARVLVVQATGWGKSAVYWAATRALRAAGEGYAIVVSPLLALIRDQIAAAGRAGLVAATVNSTNVEDWSGVLDGVRGGSVDLLLISPERLANPAFRRPAAGAAGRLWSARHRRGALRVGLGLRLPPRLPAPHPHTPRPGAGDSGARNDGDGERQGHRGRRHPTR